MPDISPITVLGHLIMMAGGLKLPTDDSSFEAPDKDQYGETKDLEKLTPAPPKLVPFFVFQTQDAQTIFQDSADEIGKQMQDFHDNACDAVKFSHGLARLQAKVKDLKVVAVSAIGAPGCLDFPKLEDNIKNAPCWASETEDNYTKYKEAVAAGVSTNFADWADNVMVPGLPWYPAFAAYPGPTAAPTPNIPMPLIACPSSSMTKITMASELKDAMVGELSGPPKDDDPDKQHEVLFDGIGTTLSLAFLLWMLSQQVMNVLGKGPVPSYAPPYVPVGPVLGGDNIATPGHLAA